jgi:hypothetical protein
VDLTRRSFLAGLGSVTVGFLFRRQLDAVLDSLERDFVAEQQAVDQLPSAVEIVVVPQAAFRPHRLVIPIENAPLFVIEDVWIGSHAQFVGGAPIPAEMFAGPDAALSLDTAAPGIEIRFRVRYIGKDPRGKRFQAALIGRAADGRERMMVLPIDSGCEIVG